MGAIRLVHLEDDPLDAELIRAALGTDLEINLIHAFDEASFRAAIIDEPDIVLADFALPNFDGRRAQLILCERWPEVPFVFVSGSLGEERAIETLRAGATDYVLKHKLRPLESVVKRALAEMEQKRARQRAEAELRALNAELEQRVRERTFELEQASEALKQARNAAERANLAKSEFLSRMSHELRTPLNAVMGFAQLFQMEELPADQCENVQQIIRGGHHLLELITEVLDISRIEAGHIDIVPAAVDVPGIAHDVLQLIRPLADRRGIALRTDWPSGDALHAMADRQRLRQILLNLCSNAVKYNRDGGTVTVSCRRVAERTVRIAVQDEGAGIAPDRQSLLFTPFERLGAQRSGIEGTGLGLALSKGLAAAMRGTLGFENRQAGGSTFFVDLPEAPRPDATATDDGTRSARRRPASSGTLLYIEDTVANVRLMERLLRQRPGVSLLHAPDGRSGLAMIHVHRPPLVMLDLHLPDMTGQEVLRQIQASGGFVPKVAILSADAMESYRRKLLSEGAYAYLTKPLNLAAVLALIDDVLESGTSTHDMARLT